MSYNAKVTLKYDSTWSSTSGFYDAEILPEQHITIEAPAEDLNIHQQFELFKSFLRAMGFAEYNIIQGACQVAFNDCNSQEQMKKVADEYDLFLAEDFREKLIEYDTQQDEEIKKLENEIKELKAKLARVLPEQYESWDGLVDDDDIKAIIDESTDGGYKPWGNLVPGSNDAVAVGCKCPVMDNAEMPEGKKWVNGDCPLHGTGK